MKRQIAISYDCRSDEPSAVYSAQIRQAFAELGWTVTQCGGGSSNVHRCHIDIESDASELDRPALVATLKRLGILWETTSVSLAMFRENTLPIVEGR